MHFTEPLYTNPLERGYNEIIECTHGCSHNKCAFCTMYKGVRFGVQPLDVWEADLREIAQRNPRAARLELVGGNPFVLSFERLMERLELVREILPHVNYIYSPTRIDDITRKTVEQLKVLRAMGIRRLAPGQESGDDWALASVNKGYVAADIIEQCRKLDEAGIEYSFTFLNGLVDRDHSEAHALNSAHVVNQLHPYLVGSGSVGLFGGSELQRRAERGEFVPLTEKERMEEMRLFLSELDVPCIISTHHTSALRVGGRFPEKKQEMLDELTYAIDNYEQFEEAMTRHRAGISQL